MNEKKHQKTGIILTVSAGIMWGFSGACGQYIFENFHVDPARLTAIRLLIAGLIITIIGFYLNAKEMKAILRDVSALKKLTVFAIVGTMFCQLSYLTAISHSNAGTATILQYVGPVLVMIVSCFMAKRLPTLIEIVSILLAIIGTFLIATHGKIETMVLTPKGLFWGLASAFGLMLYNIIPINLLKKYSSVTLSGYGMVLGGLVLCIFTKAWQFKVTMTPSFFLSLSGIIIVGTVITFTLYLAGVSICGPVKASMLSSIEPVSATVIMVFWLGASLHYMDIIGFICIFATIFLLTAKFPRKSEEA